MDLRDVMHMNKLEKTKYSMISLTYEILKMQVIKVHNKHKEMI